MMKANCSSSSTGLLLLHIAENSFFIVLVKNKQNFRRMLLHPGITVTTVWMRLELIDTVNLTINSVPLLLRPEHTGDGKAHDLFICA
jgi:hypothetical protein